MQSDKMFGTSHCDVIKNKQNTITSLNILIKETNVANSN